MRDDTLRPLTGEISAPELGPWLFEAADNRLIHPRRHLRNALRYRTFLAYWVRRNVLTRYRQTTLGPLWVVLLPLLSSLVYAFVFGVLLRVDTGPVPYALFVITNLVLWGYSTRTIMTGPAALLGNLDLVTRVRFPREFLPFGAWLESVTDLGVSVLVVAGFFWYYEVSITPYILVAGVVFLVHTILTLGLMLLVAAIAITVRDLTYALPTVLHLALYVAPIVYPLDLVPAELRPYFLLNPFSVVFAAYQETIFLGQFTLARELGLSAAFSLGLLIGGYRLFKHQEWKLADLL